jgi:hypothetical protein
MKFRRELAIPPWIGMMKSALIAGGPSTAASASAELNAKKTIPGFFSNENQKAWFLIFFKEKGGQHVMPAPAAFSRCPHFPLAIPPWIAR